MRRAGEHDARRRRAALPGCGLAAGCPSLAGFFACLGSFIRARPLDRVGSFPGVGSSLRVGPFGIGSRRRRMPEIRCLGPLFAERLENVALVERSALRRVVGVRGNRHGSSSSKSVRQAWPIGREARSLARRASAVEERLLSRPADFNSLRGDRFRVAMQRGERGIGRNAACGRSKGRPHAGAHFRA